MKTLLPLLRFSAKCAYKNLHNKLFWCIDLKGNIRITKKFHNHVSQKPRNIKDMIERLSMYPIIPDILENGKITEQRSDTSIRITLSKKTFSLSCILYPSLKGGYILLSCFKDY